MEEDIAWIRKKLKWQEQGHKRSVLHRQMWEKKCQKKKEKKEKKKKHEISIFSHYPVSQLKT